MTNFIKKMLGDKKQWRAMEARAAQLPRDYQVMYAEMQSYLWKFSAGSGMTTIAVLNDLLGLFEQGAADGRRALEVTGDDVAAFCDELLTHAHTYTQDWRTKLNRDVAEKLQREEGSS